MKKIISLFLILTTLLGLGVMAFLATSKNAQAVNFVSAPMPSPEYYVNLNSIVQITCGTRTGTAVVVDRDILFTVYHVTGNDQCTLGGKPLTTAYWSRELDFAVLTGDLGDRPPIPVRCNGFVSDEEILFIGYAGGKDFAVTRGTASRGYFTGRDQKTEQPFERVRVLNGRSYRGMSGGPALDRNGYVVGLVNAVPTKDEPLKKLVYSREIKDTFACQDR